MKYLFLALGVKYIISIIGLSIFAVLCFIYLIVYIKTRKHDVEQEKAINEIYSGVKGAKMEYESSSYDAETEEKILRMQQHSEGQLTIDDVITDTGQEVEALVGSYDGDGVEEITGSYNPDT